MNRSPLHDKHLELGARFTDFGDWEMPVRYGSVISEHQAVRHSAGWFDVSHLGRFSLIGDGTTGALRRLLCNDLGRIGPGRCQYTMILNDQGGIIDDLIVWWRTQGRFWVMPNAANHRRVMAVFGTEPDVEVHDLREHTVMLAVQGPEAPAAVESILGSVSSRMRSSSVEWHGSRVEMAGTGYTGEPGAEICLQPETALDFVDALAGAGVTPAGLGARDTLRLEAGLSLWGEDIDETTTPLEAGLGFAVSWEHEFVGREALMRQKEEGVSRARVGFILDDRGVPRHGHRLRTGSGGEGTVTSGNISPMLGTGIGLGYVSPPPAVDDTIEVEIRARWVPARIAKPPFHR